MAKSSTRRVTIYINGKEMEASVKQLSYRALVPVGAGVWNRTCIGVSDGVRLAGQSQPVSVIRDNRRGSRVKPAMRSGAFGSKEPPVTALPSTTRYLSTLSSPRP